MPMRYLVRREKAEDFTDIKSQVSDLDTQLGSAGAGLRRDIKVRLDNNRALMYQFRPRKNGADWVWVCPTIELVAENEQGLFVLTDQLGVPRPAHLAHLSAEK